MNKKKYSSLKKQLTNKIPCEMHFNTQTTFTGHEIANMFSTFFESVFVEEDHNMFTAEQIIFNNIVNLLSKL